jgi:hypothetical protein
VARRRESEPLGIMTREPHVTESEGGPSLT